MFPELILTWNTIDPLIMLDSPKVRRSHAEQNTSWVIGLLRAVLFFADLWRRLAIQTTTVALKISVDVWQTKDNGHECRRLPPVSDLPFYDRSLAFIFATHRYLIYRVFPPSIVVSVYQISTNTHRNSYISFTLAQLSRPCIPNQRTHVASDHSHSELRTKVFFTLWPVLLHVITLL